jgi:hypothetical protein
LTNFRQIIDRWRFLGKHAEADHVSAAIVTFQAIYPQILENFDGDANLKRHQREELLNQLTRVDPNDLVAVQGKVESFCRAHEGKGPRQPTAQRSDLGHIHSRATLTEYLASSGNWTSPFRRRGFSATLAVDLILRLDLASQRDYLSGVRLSRYQMWSFYQSRAITDPFRGVSKESDQLERRLGLGHIVPPVELLLWTHRLRPEQTASVPTTLDAALYQFFRPGGKTHPLTGDDGLREVVHPPISGDQLTRPIEPAV